MMPTSQLSSNDLKKHKTGLGNAQLFVLNIFLAIKLFYLDPRFKHLLLERIFQIEVAKRRHA